MITLKASDSIPFGRYKGQNVIECIKSYPNYFHWWINNVKTHTFNQSLIDYINNHYKPATYTNNSTDYEVYGKDGWDLGLCGQN